MRRNAESLLVLAGIEPPRKWAAPVRLTDVIRAALGEVEDYQRVTVRGVEPATIIGSAAADLAHLLAELIENALVFSPPDQTVDIRGRQTPTATPSPSSTPASACPTTDITAANRRLAGAESFTIAPSKYLGHYVAGNLAARHNIHVTLDNSPGNGITATIDLPPTLLTTDDESSPPRSRRPTAHRPRPPRRPGLRWRRGRRPTRSSAPPAAAADPPGPSLRRRRAGPAPPRPAPRAASSSATPATAAEPDRRRRSAVRRPARQPEPARHQPARAASAPPPFAPPAVDREPGPDGRWRRRPRRQRCRPHAGPPRPGAGRRPVTRRPDRRARTASRHAAGEGACPPRPRRARRHRARAGDRGSHRAAASTPPGPRRPACPATQPLLSCVARAPAGRPPAARRPTPAASRRRPSGRRAAGARAPVATGPRLRRAGPPTPAARHAPASPRPERLARAQRRRPTTSTASSAASPPGCAGASRPTRRATSRHRRDER